MNDRNTLFGENIRRLRKKNNLTQNEFAEKIEVSGKTVSKWEMGNTYPDRRKILKIAKVFGVRIGDLEDGYITEDVSHDKNMEQIICFMNEINKKLCRIVKDRDVTSEYLKASKTYDAYTNCSIIDFREPPSEEEIEFYEWKNVYEKEIYDYITEMDFDKALECCDELIAKGFGEMAENAIFVCDEYMKFIDTSTSLEEIEQNFYLRKKYARIYIHHLMKKYDVNIDELLT